MGISRVFIFTSTDTQYPTPAVPAFSPCRLHAFLVPPLFLRLFAVLKLKKSKITHSSSRESHRIFEAQRPLAGTRRCRRLRLRFTKNARPDTHEPLSRSHPRPPERPTKLKVNKPSRLFGLHVSKPRYTSRYDRRKCCLRRALRLFNDTSPSLSRRQVTDDHRQISHSSIDTFVPSEVC
jgi:hypothetical protein